MADAVDYATDLIEHQRAEALARQVAEAERTRRVEEAMRPRSEQDAEICTDCGESIDPRRRELLPLTNRCTDCAALAERLYREKAWMPR